MDIGHVYLVRAEGTSLYKIGSSRRPISLRIKELNRMQQPHPVTLIHWITVPNYKNVENKLHNQYESFRRHNEWFEFDDYESVTVVMNAIEREPGDIFFAELKLIFNKLDTLKTSNPYLFSHLCELSRDNGDFTLDEALLAIQELVVSK
ncbi:hypothetical protein NIES2100_73700 [Calothrix sp. NIES-2100]|uniref:GIY-YIG nuclease family protein n=1 Tax=Calothrix sp. NIES-2100 TaxID=1954172 RepID=UPI000B6132E9|nr:hypothetical protein NIES2100_73700 [Calothrix sp. NIES-2100]